MIITDDDKFRIICISGSIIAEGGTADDQAQATISEFDEIRHLLQEWRDITANMYSDGRDLLDGLPDPKEIDFIKLLGGMLSHDTCPTNQLKGLKLADIIT